MKNNYDQKLSEYINFLKKEKIYEKKNLLKYELTLEKLQNWNNSNFNEIFKWYLKIKKNNKAKIRFQHLEKLQKWNYNKQKGIIYHVSGGFFSIVGLKIENAGREVSNWDQPFIKQRNLVGGIIGLVRKKINNLPHYLVEAKFEPGNYNSIQISPSVQATYSNLNQVHKGSRNEIIRAFYKENFKTIRKIWVSEDGGRLYKKRNLHWIINTDKKIIKLPNNYRWLTLWEIEQFMKKGTYVGPHLRAILSLI